MKVVKISPGKNAQYWEDCRENKHICVGWSKVPDLRHFDSFEELREAVKKYQYRGTHGPAWTTAEQLWTLKNLETGDEVIANKGIDTIIGIGRVTRPYRWQDHYPDQHAYPHTVPVDWDTSYEEQRIPAQQAWMNKTVAAIDSPKLYKLITGERLPKSANSGQTPASRKDLNLLDELDKKHQGLIRAEQGLLRKHVLGGKNHGVCVICGAKLPVELLVAAHIKPRAKCSNAEKRDWANVVPMCLLGCDALFERGRVAVVGGSLDIRFDEPIRDSRLKTLLKALRAREIAVEPGQLKYFEYRAKHSR